jgi:hypothetical protein
MPPERQTVKSMEKVIDSSDDDDDMPLPSPTLLERSASPSSSSPSVSSSVSSSASLSPSISRANSPSRPPSPESASYRYEPPSTHELSPSRGKSVLPTLRPQEELFYLRFPRSVSLENAQFNLRKRKVRIGEEEWQLIEEDVDDIRVIHSRENSENFSLGI